MLTAKNLEKLIELETSLRAEYQTQLDAKSAEIESSNKKVEDQQAVIARQLEQISTLSTQASANKRTEQLNRELEARSEKLQEEVSSQKSRLKALQKDLAAERTEIKTLKQLDAAAIKKNLIASKKKLVEKTTANDLLQKSTNKYKNENADLQRKITELEARLEQLESTDEEEAAAA
jgi:hypothetical protein